MSADKIGFWVILDKSRKYLIKFGAESDTIKPSEIIDYWGFYPRMKDARKVVEGFIKCDIEILRANRFGIDSLNSREMVRQYERSRIRSS